MFAVYLLFLGWAILWKCRVPFIGGTERVNNLIPFRGNAGYEKLFNLVLFVPLGFYIAMVAKNGVIKQISTVLENPEYGLKVPDKDLSNTVWFYIAVEDTEKN